MLLPDHMDLYFKECLRLAGDAAQKNEVPIAAIVVKDGKIIASASNETETQNSFLAHAELLAIKKASEFLNSKYLNGCEIFVTLEPCMMCQTAARLSRIDAIHYLVASEKFGESGPAYHPVEIQKHDHSLADDSRILLRRFFESRR